MDICRTRAVQLVLVDIVDRRETPLARKYPHLEGGRAQAYTRVLTSLALLHATYDRFVSRAPLGEALEWPPFDEWLADRADALRHDRAGE